MTQSQVEAKINQLVDLLDQKYFTTTGQSCGNSSCDLCKNSNVFKASWFQNLFGTVSTSQIPGHAYPNGGTGYPTGWTCHGFANFAMWYVFSSKNSDKVTYDRVVDDVKLTKSNLQKYAKPGDVIRYSNHSVMLISIDSTGFTVIDCNYRLSGDSHARVRKHTISYSGKDSYTMAISRAQNYETASTLSIHYNANGGSMSSEMLYKISTGGLVLRMRAGTSTSTAILTTIPDGTVITVTETQTTGGYTWAKTTYNDKTGWCAVINGSDINAVRIGYYLSDSIIYQYESSSIYTQQWKSDAIAWDGLANASDFSLVREGYSFVGWSASPDGSTGVFDPDDSTLQAEEICPALKDGNQTITLYAIWKKDCANHQYTISVIAPTCTQQGYTIHRCAACGDSYTDSYLLATGHTLLKYDYDDTEHRKICSVCNQTYEYEPHTIQTNECICGFKHITVEAQDSAENRISYAVTGQYLTVTHGDACIVVYEDAETDDVIELMPTMNADGSYQYQAPEFVEKIFIAVKGDYNGDGSLTADDANALKDALLEKTEYNGTALYVLDINRDGKITALDLALINGAANGLLSLWQ